MLKLYRSIELVYLMLRIGFIRAKLYWKNLVLYAISRLALLFLLITFWNALVRSFRIEALGLNELSISAIIGFYYLVWGIISLVWGIKRLGDYITYAKLDTFIIRPINLSMLLILYNIHGGCFIQIIFGLSMFVYVVALLHPSLLCIALSLGLAFEGVLLYVLIQAFIGLLTVALVKSEYVSELVDWFYEYSYVPVTYMVSSVREVLTFGIPVAFIAILPGLSLTKIISVKYSIHLLILGLFLASAWYIAYRIALAKVMSKYESALG